MKRGHFRFGWGLALLCLPLVIFWMSCGGGGGDSGGSTGTMNLSITDQATTDYRAIYVTIKQVEVHKDGGAGWQVVPLQFEKKTFNLLELVNGVREELALATLATGHYTQMRLILGDTPDNSINILSTPHLYANYLIEFIGNTHELHELKVPSGFQTGIKIVKGFDINANETTELILDFDANRSIVRAGSNGDWLLKPTIKLLNTTECSIIQGNAGQGGVLVSAQVYNSEATAPEFEVEIKAATATDPSGNYKLFLEAGTYILVAYKDDYAVSYAKITTTAGNTYSANFTLVTSDMGTLTGDVPISGGDTEQYATISIRKAISATEQIEIKSLNVGNGGTFSTDLPVGVNIYTAVISTSGKTARVEGPFTISKESTTPLGPVGW